MNSHPILFSRPMVLALLAGTKTQTRRLLTPANSTVQGYNVTTSNPTPWLCLNFDNATFQPDSIWGKKDLHLSVPFGPPEEEVRHRVRPRLQVGDHLWVREEHYKYGHWQEIPGVKTKRGRSKWKFVVLMPDLLFDAPPEFRKGRHHKDPATPAWHKRLARFMPHAYSRLTLEVTGLKAERLRSISEEDALAEGVEPYTPHVTGMLKGRKDELPSAAYRTLWESLHGPDSWTANPWVWVTQFRRL